MTRSCKTGSVKLTASPTSPRNVPDNLRLSREAFSRGSAQRQAAKPGLVVRVHFHQPGPGILPLRPPHLKR